jgi:hypothetical protein
LIINEQLCRASISNLSEVSKEKGVEVKGIISAVAAAIFLSGCTTSPNLLREAGPDETYVSTKDVKDIAMCIADKWEDRSVVVTREMEDGISVRVPAGASLRYMADVLRKGPNSVTYGYYFMVIPITRDPMMAAIQNCQ